MQYHVHQDSNLRFWLDPWYPDGPLITLISGPLHKHEQDLTLKSCITNLKWHLDNLSFPLPPIIQQKISSLPISFNTDNKLHIPYWKFSHNGHFSTRSAYALSTQTSTVQQFHDCTWIWKLQILNKIKYFIWLCFLDRLPTVLSLFQKGLNINPVCCLCHLQLETTLHSLRDCKSAQTFWLQVLPHTSYNINTFFTQNIQSWLQENCKNTTSFMDYTNWSIFFSLSCWTLWLNRNHKLYKQND